MATFYDLLNSTHSAQTDQQSQSSLKLIEAHVRGLATTFGSSGRALGQVAGGALQPAGAGLVKAAIGQINDFAAEVSKAIAPFRELVDTAARFTQEIDPSLVADLNRGFRDLRAVAGIALRPIVEQGRELVWYIAGTFLPLARRLGDILKILTSEVGERFKLAISRVADLVNAVPWEAVGEAFSGLLTIVNDLGEAAMAISSGLFDFVKKMIGDMGGGIGTVKSLMAEVRDAIQQAIKAVIVFAATLMKALGWTGMARSLTEGLKAAMQPAKDKGDDARGLAAASGAAIKQIQDLAKSVYEQAFVASAYGGKEEADPAKQSAKFLGEILTAIHALPAGNVIADNMFKAVDGLYEQVYNFLDGKIDAAQSYVGKHIEDVKVTFGQVKGLVADIDLATQNIKIALGNANSFAQGAAKASGEVASDIKQVGRAGIKVVGAVMPWLDL